MFVLIILYSVYDFCLVRPFLSEVDYRDTEKIVREFEQGVGKDLHNQLLDVAKDQRNWV